MSSDRGRAVLVTTEFRGVFFGYVKDESKLPGEITLTRARNCISWSSKMNGFLGLAEIGPDDSCRISTQVEELTLYKITSVSNISDRAVEAWESDIWS